MTKRKPSNEELAVPAPFEVDGIRHRSDCAAVNWPAFTIRRPDCTCGATVQPAAAPADDGLRDAVIAAYIAGATDVHESHEPNSAPEFTEAAHDYATSVLRPDAQPAAPEPACQPTVECAACGEETTGWLMCTRSGCPAGQPAAPASASPFDAAYWERVARDRAADCGRLQLALERWAAAFPHEAALREMTRAAIADDERPAVQPVTLAGGADQCPHRQMGCTKRPPCEACAVRAPEPAPACQPTVEWQGASR